MLYVQMSGKVMWYPWWKKGRPEGTEDAGREPENLERVCTQKDRST